MGAVKSRHQTGDTDPHHNTMPVISKRKKCGSSSDTPDRDKDRSRSVDRTLAFSSRKTDTKMDRSFSCLSSRQPDKAAPVSNRLVVNGQALSSLAGAETSPVSETESSAQSNSVGSFQFLGEQFHDSLGKQDMLHHQRLNLDTHPAVTRLQNEQNQRLEGMEQRMNKIRKNAQQEAERRKFAHLFRARTEEKADTEHLLKEASVALQLFKREKQLKKSNSSCGESNSCAVAERKGESDKGDIIPVRIVSAKASMAHGSDKVELSSSGSGCGSGSLRSSEQQPLLWLLQPVQRFELNGVVLWLLLPFLLPVLLLLHLLRHLSPSSDYHNNSKKN